MIKDSKAHTLSPMGKKEMMRTKFSVVTHNLFLIAIWDSGVIKYLIISERGTEFSHKRSDIY